MKHGAGIGKTNACHRMSWAPPPTFVLPCPSHNINGQEKNTELETHTQSDKKKDNRNNNHINRPTHVQASCFPDKKKKKTMNERPWPPMRPMDDATSRTILMN